jgi:hypothetical protein
MNVMSLILIKSVEGFASISAIDADAIAKLKLRWQVTARVAGGGGGFVYGGR